MENRIGIVLPVAYLPSVDQYCHIACNSKILFEIEETYPKQTCRNRTNIMTANGILRLTIPVIKPNGNKTKTSEVITDHKSNWKKMHIRAISSAYNKSPFYLYYKDEIEAIYNMHTEKLIDFNMQFILLINKFLKVTPAIELTKVFEKQYSAYMDLRECNKDLMKTDHELPYYTQVFSDRLPYTSNLSILDLIFNKGPASLAYLKSCKTVNQQSY